MIDTQAIRSKILDLAMRGKLTEQLPEDGTAEELYRQIQAEKQALVKAGKSKQEKPLPEVADDEVLFEIPSNWKWVRLADISTTNIGLTYHPEDIAQEGTIVVRSSNIINSRLDYADLVKVRCSIRDNQYLNHNDIVICARNGSKALVGKCAIFEGESGTVAFGAFMAVLRTPFYRYVFFYLRTNAFRRYFHSDDSKQINQVTQNILKEALVPLPPLAEQHRIVEKITQAFSILDTIDALQAQYADNLTVLKNKLIDAAIQGKLTEQLPEDGTAEEFLECLREEKKAIENSGVLKGRKKKAILPLDDVACPFTIPATWKWIRLDSVAEIFGRIGFRGYTKNDIVEQGKGAISLSPSNITIDGKCTYEKCTFISWEKYDESPEIMVNEEDVIIVKTGSSYGKCGVVKGLPEKATINPQLALLKYILCNRYYLHIVLNSTMARKQYEDFVVGAATPTFSQEDLANFILPLPPLAEQKRIVERVTGLLAVCDELKCDEPHFKGKSSYE